MTGSGRGVNEALGNGGCHGRACIVGQKETGGALSAGGGRGVDAAPTNACGVGHALHHLICAVGCEEEVSITSGTSVGPYIESLAIGVGSGPCSAYSRSVDVVRSHVGAGQALDSSVGGKQPRSGTVAIALGVGHAAGDNRCLRDGA